MAQLKKTTSDKKPKRKAKKGAGDTRFGNRVSGGTGKVPKRKRVAAEPMHNFTSR